MESQTTQQPQMSPEVLMAMEEARGKLTQEQLDWIAEYWQEMYKATGDPEEADEETIIALDPPYNWNPKAQTPAEAVDLMLM